MSIHGRNLCRSCYNHERTAGSFTEYPTIRDIVRESSMRCRCAKPLVDRLYLFGVAQCASCGRKIDDERIDELRDDG